MAYRVQYFHRNTGEIASIRAAAVDAALDIARQLIFDGELEVKVISEDGSAPPPETWAALGETLVTAEP